MIVDKAGLKYLVGMLGEIINRCLKLLNSNKTQTHLVGIMLNNSSVKLKFANF
jgi:hypothetical protein